MARAKLTGVLYLENALIPRAFAPSRSAVLKLLASQAAIALESAHLYRDLEQREAKIRRLPTSSASTSGTSKVGSSRPTTPFSAWWDTSVKISSPVAWAGRT
jgi:hypothetical protein